MTGSEQRPRFTVVSAVYNVEPYLQDFIDSIEAQRFDLGRVEVIAVDDGSTDGSLAMLEAWARRRPGLLTVLSKANGGQASARNLGIEQATGEWITFSDPDDRLDADFFAAADQFAASHREVAILGAKPIVFDEASGRLLEHPRAAQYQHGNRRVDLRRDPNVFPGGTILCLFQLDRVRETGLRFDERLKPVFEDVHFTARYLLELPRPVVGIVPDSRYVYRRRATNDSTLQRGWTDPGRYREVLKLGHLDLIGRAKARFGAVPEWVQQLVIYDLSWYLSEDEKITSQIRIAPDLLPTFEQLFGEVVRNLDPGAVQRHTTRRLKPLWSDVLEHAFRPESWHARSVRRTKVDPAMGLQRIEFRFTGPEPAAEFRLAGRAVTPVYSKETTCTFFGLPLLKERISWLPLGRLDVRLDGSPVVTEAASPERQGRFRRRLSTGLQAGRRVLTRADGPGPDIALARRVNQLSGAVLRRVARLPAWSKYRGAWVLMDRIDKASDNAERLAGYIAAERPDLNAWFVLERGTPAWKRLEDAGTVRLVARRSLQWTMLMLNSSWLISSHADQAIIEPPELMRVLSRAPWRSAFLQHGVTQADLSKWLNRRDFDLIVVSTQDELRSLVADGTAYRYTTREVRATGMPRFDRLIALGRQVAIDDRNLVILAPTWRKWLVDESDPITGSRAVEPHFWESDYLAHWMAVVNSPEIAEAASKRGWSVAFMPHPNLQPILADIELPPHVISVGFEDGDVQATYARAALLVTDYSSVAFDVAALDRPIVYFQFDREEFFGGAHIGSAGYFDYDRDGLGPVGTTVPDAIDLIVASIERGPSPSVEYQARIDRTFATRDGQASARVVAAIESLSRPYRRPTPTGQP